MNLSQSRTKSIWIVLAAVLATLLAADELTAAPVHRSQRTLRDSEVLGVPWNADGLSNVQVGGQQNRRVGIRFRADRDGTLDRIKLFFIFSTWEDFAAEGSTQCQDDHLGCYGAGDGGDLLIQVRADDGSSRHAPSGRVLSSRLIRHPMNRNRKPPVYAVGSGLGGRAVWNFWVIDMPDVRLQAGRLYHIVLSNPSRDPVNNFVSLDHLYVAANAPHMQPAVSDVNLASEVLQRNDSRWRIRYGETPIFEIRYTGGFVQGQGYSGTSVSYPASIYGQYMVRETVSSLRHARTFDRVFLRLSATGSPGPLVVRLETGSGALIEEGQISSSSIGPQDTWVRYAFRQPRRIPAGQAFSLVLSANGDVSNQYRIFTLLEGDWAGFVAPNLFRQGQAQVNEGSGWRRAFSGYDADYQLYFVGRR